MGNEKISRSMKAKMNKKSTPSKGGVTYRSSSRRNGWSCPAHPLQFIAWIFIIFFAVMFHGMAVPTVPFHWQPACHMIVGITLAVHVITHLVCLTIDPADPSTLRKNKKPMPTLDRTKHCHVIENNHCYLCEVDVGLKSKHCSSCNKCVASFDHHCKWLNNCVGSRNYRWFITCLSSAFLCCLFVFTVFLYLSVVYWVNPRLLHPELFDGAATTQPTFAADEATAEQVTSNSTSQSPGLDPLEAYRSGLKIFDDVPGIAFFVVALVIAVLLFVTLCLLGHLLGFHIYLICNGMSTYNYVMQDRNAFISADAESQQRRQPKKEGCCKCHNQVAPMREAKEEIELTDTKKESATSQLKSNNNSSPNLQQQLVIAEPLIKHEQQQQQQQVQMTTAANDSKPKIKKKKKPKKKHQRLPSLTARESLQPTRMGHPYPTPQMNLANSMPQTYLEQHLVRRFSLPLVTPAGMHPQYPPTEPVEDLFFTQQFPTMQQPVINPHGGQSQRHQIARPTAISLDSPTPALDYHSSSAESLIEIPVGRYHRGSFSNPVPKAMLPGGYQLASGYQQPLEKWNLNHNSHPNLMMNGRQGGPKLVDSKARSSSHVKKSKRKSARTKNGEVPDSTRQPNETERRRRDSIQEPLLVNTIQEIEGNQDPSVARLDQNPGENLERGTKKNSPASSETTADVHWQLSDHSGVARLSSNESRQQVLLEPHLEATVAPKPHLKSQVGEATVSEDRTQNTKKPPQTLPIAAPRRRALKFGQDPPSRSDSQTSLQSSSSHQHLLESVVRDAGPPSATSRKGEPQDDSLHDDVSLPGSIPEVPPLDLGPLADTCNSDAGTVTQRAPSEGGSLSDEQLVEGYSSKDKSYSSARPMASRRSLLLRY